MHTMQKEVNKLTKEIK